MIEYIILIVVIFISNAVLMTKIRNLSERVKKLEERK